MTERLEIDHERTVFSQGAREAWRGVAILLVLAAGCLACALVSLLTGGSVPTTAFFLVVAAAAVWLVWRSRGGLRVEVTPEVITFDLGHRTGVPIRREGVEQVVVVHFPRRRHSLLVVRRRGHRISHRRHFGLFNPADMAQALRRAGWPVTEDRSRPRLA